MTIMSTALLPVLSDRPMAGSIQASMSLPILPFQRRQPLSYGMSMKGTGSLPDILEALRNCASAEKTEPFTNNVTSPETTLRPRTTSLDEPTVLPNTDNIVSTFLPEATESPQLPA